MTLWKTAAPAGRPSEPQGSTLGDQPRAGTVIEAQVLLGSAEGAERLDLSGALGQSRPGVVIPALMGGGFRRGVFVAVRTGSKFTVRSR